MARKGERGGRGVKQGGRRRGVRKSWQRGEKVEGKGEERERKESDNQREKTNK